MERRKLGALINFNIARRRVNPQAQPEPIVDLNPVVPIPATPAPVPAPAPRRRARVSRNRIPVATASYSFVPPDMNIPQGTGLIKSNIFQSTNVTSRGVVANNDTRLPEYPASSIQNVFPLYTEIVPNANVQVISAPKRRPNVVQERHNKRRVAPKDEL